MLTIRTNPDRPGTGDVFGPDGQPIKALVTAINIDMKPLDITATITIVGFDCEIVPTRARWVMHSPITGKPQEVRRIVFADGSAAEFTSDGVTPIPPPSPKEIPR